MVFLWSDILIFSLLAAGLLWFKFAIRREYWKIALKKIISNRVAMISFGILTIYCFLGLTDSIHFREDYGKSQKGHIISLLDLISKPLIDSTEKTYSAPFALYSYSKNTFFYPDGRKYRDYPKLKFGGKGIRDHEERTGDILSRLFKALLSGIFGAFFLSIIYFLFGYFRNQDRKKYAGSVKILILEGFPLRFFTVSTLFISIFFTIIYLAPRYHILGTDKAGFDVFYIALKGARTGLIIGTLTTLIVTPFAIFFGIVAGLYGGLLDDIVQYIYTTLSSIPDILLIAAAMLIFQVGLSMDETVISADKRLVYLCVIMGITSWTGLCRLIRAEVLKLRELEYIQAARALGIRKWKIMIQHLVPNIMHIILITVILRFSGLVLAEAVLSYIGIGVDPNMQSWGNMINQARLEMARDPVVWWNLVASFFFMLGLVLPANIFGDAVRDALDPRIKEK